MNKWLLKKLVIMEAERVVELLNELEENQMNSNEGGPMKAELKAKMAELRRDTMKIDKFLRTWERI